MSSRYSAKLLFQWRVRSGRRSNKRRLCEERIICFRASSAEKAFERASKTGKDGEYTDERDGKKIFFEFVGVQELIDLLVEDPEEVWWDLVERLEPMERRSLLIPRKRDLAVFAKVPRKRVSV